MFVYHVKKKYRLLPFVLICVPLLDLFLLAVSRQASPPVLVERVVALERPIQMTTANGENHQSLFMRSCLYSTLITLVCDVILQ